MTKAHADPSLQLPTDSCQNLYLERKKEKFKLKRRRNDYPVPFLCLKKSKIKPTTKSLTTASTKGKITLSSNKQTVITFLNQ